MSIKVTTWIWEHCEEKSTRLLLMLALADWSDDEGVSWPSIGRLAHKCRTTKRNVQKILTNLEQEGELIVIRNGGMTTEKGCTNRYLLAKYREEKGFKNPKTKPLRGDNSDTPPSSSRGELEDTPRNPRDEPAFRGGVNTSTSPGVNPSTPNTSVDTSVDTSVKDIPPTQTPSPPAAPSEVASATPKTNTQESGSADHPPSRDEKTDDHRKGARADNADDAQKHDHPKSNDLTPSQETTDALASQSHAARQSSATSADPPPKSPSPLDRLAPHHRPAPLPKPQPAKPAAASGDKPAKKSRQPDPLYDAIAEVFGAHGAKNGNIRILLTGHTKKAKNKKSAWFECRLDQPATADEVRAFGKAYKRKYPDRAMVQKPENIQSYFIELVRKPGQKPERDPYYVNPNGPSVDLSKIDWDNAVWKKKKSANPEVN